MTDHIVLFVDSEPVLADAGAGESTCLRVKHEGSTDWELFYDVIHGFDFVPGIAYELEVAVSQVKDPTPDMSSLRYELVRTISPRTKSID